MTPSNDSIPVKETPEWSPGSGLQLASLGSGSAGNSLLVRSKTTTLLLDCGFTLKETVARLATLGVSPTELDGVLITHEHGDHTKGVGPLSRKFNLPVWMTEGTARACKDKKFPNLNYFSVHSEFTIGDVLLDPFPTPHDAAESCQFVFRLGHLSIGCLTDLGACTSHVLEKVKGVNALLLESNYDLEMLRNGPYPPSLQARITSNWGHLGNDQAGELLARLDHENLQYVWLGHLSERNNTDEAALETVSRYVESGVERLNVLPQHTCSPWFTIA